MTIHELIQRSGFSRRTIYYYTQIGLLPPPKGKGKNYQYEEEHLERLLFIKKMQMARYSLREIQELLNRQDLPEIAEAAEAVPLMADRFELAEERLDFQTPPRNQLARNFALRLQLARGLELFIQWPLTPEGRRYLQNNLPEILTILEG
ncbi:MAG: hypothetical protein Kow0042_23550 [Calditrichia bacterium]